MAITMGDTSDKSEALSKATLQIEAGTRFVVRGYAASITSSSTALVEGAVDTLVRHGGAASDITIVRVPGSLGVAAGRPPKFATRDDVDSDHRVGSTHSRRHRPLRLHLRGGEQRVWRRCRWQTRLCRCPSVSSPPTPSNRPSNGPAPKPATRAPRRQWPPSNWSSLMAASCPES